MLLCTPTVLLVGPDDAVRRAVQQLSGEVPIEIAEATNAALSAFFERIPPALVMIGPDMPRPWDALHTARIVRQWSPTVPIALVTSNGSEDLAIAAMRAGVSDYFRTPIEPDDFHQGVCRLLADVSEPDVPQPQEAPSRQTERLVGTSREASSIRKSIERLASTDCTALITGETGTGKELAARLIHAGSRRSARPFVSINCAAIPESLVESELFGYERGAFTGATSANRGRVLAADRGTAFFDEIGDLSPVAQAKVLRLVEEKEVNRLGTARSVHVDTRIVAATNRNLAALIKEGTFRSDLYFRLNVGRIHVPALRDRREDIPVLLTHYLGVACRGLRRQVDGFTADALDTLVRYDWPGNVRELKNVVQRLMIDSTSPRIEAHHLPEELVRPASNGDSTAIERARILGALSSAKGNKSAAARALGWSRMTLYRKMVRHELEPRAD